MNKKALSRIIMNFTFFGISIVFIMFVLILGWEIFSDNVLNTVYDAITNLDLDIGSTAVSTIDNVKDKTQNEGYFNFDILFLFIGLIIMFYFARKSYLKGPISVMSVISTLITTQIMFGLIYIYFSDIVTWFTTQIFFNLITDINLPIFENYLANFGLYIFFFINVLVVVNQLPYLAQKFGVGGVEV